MAAAGRAIDETGAEVVVGFGGYVSTPAYLAARRRGVPIVVHEQNARAGLANRLGARFTRYVATTFAVHRAARAPRVVGHAAAPRDRDARPRRPTAPRRSSASGSTRSGRPSWSPAGRWEPSASTRPSRPGSRRCAPPASRCCTSPASARSSSLRPRRPARPTSWPPYADRMDLAYAAADLVVARAGANTVCELTAVGLPAVYVPLPIGNGEQRFNAADVVAAGGGLLVDDAAVTPEWIDRDAVPLLGDGSAAGRRWRRPPPRSGERGGDELLADLVCAACAESRRGTR